MSPVDDAAVGIRGRRIPGKVKRFDPTEPFHMSTRHGKKPSFSNGTPSTSGSYQDLDSRRESLDDRPITSCSNGTQMSAKSRQGPLESPLQPPPLTTLDAFPSTMFSPDRANKDNVMNSSSPIGRSPVAHSLSPSRKRKRSSSKVSNANQQNGVGELTSFDQTVSSPMHDGHEGDEVQVVPATDLSDREESDEDDSEAAEASPGSSQSQKLAQACDTMVGNSVDDTPAMSQHPSPATSG